MTRCRIPGRPGYRRSAELQLCAAQSRFWLANELAHFHRAQGCFEYLIIQKVPALPFSVKLYETALPPKRIAANVSPGHWKHTKIWKIRKFPSNICRKRYITGCRTVPSA